MLKSGKKGNIVVPAGIDLRGWERFRHLLLDFFNADDEPKAPNSEKKTIQKPPFGTRLENQSQPPHPLQSSQYGKSPRVMPSHSDEEGSSKGEKRVRKICWEDTLVVTKRDFHNDWQRILEVLQAQIQNTFIINPFHTDKALLKCPDLSSHNEQGLGYLWSFNFENGKMGSKKTWENVDCSLLRRLD